MAPPNNAEARSAKPTRVAPAEMWNSICFNDGQGVATLRYIADGVFTRQLCRILTRLFTWGNPLRTLVAFDKRIGRKLRPGMGFLGESRLRTRSQCVVVICRCMAAFGTGIDAFPKSLPAILIVKEKNSRLDPSRRSSAMYL